MKNILYWKISILLNAQKDLCFKVIKKPVLTSARKYLENGIYKTQGIFFLIYFMYRLNFLQQNLRATYRNSFGRIRFKKGFLLYS